MALNARQYQAACEIYGKRYVDDMIDKGKRKGIIIKPSREISDKYDEITSNHTRSPTLSFIEMNKRANRQRRVDYGCNSASAGYDFKSFSQIKQKDKVVDHGVKFFGIQPVRARQGPRMPMISYFFRKGEFAKTGKWGKA